MINYRIKAYDVNNRVLFDKKGKFDSIEEGVAAFWKRYCGLDELSLIVNHAFKLSGGLTANKVTPLPKNIVKKITLYHIPTGETHTKLI